MLTVVSDRHVPSAGSDVLDMTQGGIQGLWASHANTVTDDEWGVRVNMAFSRATSGARVKSRPPLEGCVLVTLKRKTSLWFRKPS